MICSAHTSGFVADSRYTKEYKRVPKTRKAPGEKLIQKSLLLIIFISIA
jgi:hypothetical protein